MSGERVSVNVPSMTPGPQETRDLQNIQDVGSPTMKKALWAQETKNSLRESRRLSAAPNPAVNEVRSPIPTTSPLLDACSQVYM